MSHLPDPWGWWFHFLELLAVPIPWLHSVGNCAPPTLPSFAKRVPIPETPQDDPDLHPEIFWPIETNEMAPHFKTNEAAQMVSESPSELIFPFIVHICPWIALWSIPVVS